MQTKTYKIESKMDELGLSVLVVGISSVEELPVGVVVSKVGSVVTVPPKLQAHRVSTRARIRNPEMSCFMLTSRNILECSYYSRKSCL